MTDNEIIKALECCGSNGWGEEDIRPCDNCPMQECEDCEVELPDYALNLINRQKAEIEQLKLENRVLSQKRITMPERLELVTNARTKAIREFGHFLINKADMKNNIHISCLPDFVAEFIRKETES